MKRRGFLKILGLAAASIPLAGFVSKKLEEPNAECLQENIVPSGYPGEWFVAEELNGVITDIRPPVHYNCRCISTLHPYLDTRTGMLGLALSRLEASNDGRIPLEEVNG